MKKTFLAMGSALVLALSLVACDVADDDTNDPIEQPNKFANEACVDYRTDLGDSYIEVCDGFESEDEFLAWFIEGEANCAESKWKVELTDLQTSDWEKCLVGISQLDENDCDRLFGDDPVYLDDIVPACGLWWPAV